MQPTQDTIQTAIILTAFLAMGAISIILALAVDKLKEARK